MLGRVSLPARGSTPCRPAPGRGQQGLVSRPGSGRRAALAALPRAGDRRRFPPGDSQGSPRGLGVPRDSPRPPPHEARAPGP